MKRILLSSVIAAALFLSVSLAAFAAGNGDMSRDRDRTHVRLYASDCSGYRRYDRTCDQSRTMLHLRDRLDASCTP